MSNKTDFNTAVSSRCSTGLAANRVNDKLEAKLIKTEGFLTKGSKIWGVSILTGAARVVFGIGQALLAIPLALFKLGEHICYTARSKRGEALLASREMDRALEYIFHGLGNIFRGAVEIGFFWCKPDLDGVHFAYGTEGKNVFIDLPAQIEHHASVDRATTRAIKKQEHEQNKARNLNLNALNNTIICPLERQKLEQERAAAAERVHGQPDLLATATLDGIDIADVMSFLDHKLEAELERSSSGSSQSSSDESYGMALIDE